MSAFGGCSLLASIEIPDSVSSIGYAAFVMCSSLTNISVDANNLFYESIDGNLYSKEGKELVQYVAGKTTTSFSIPDSVTSIGLYAFAYCDSLTSVTIPDSVTSIGPGAFFDCNSLISIKIGDSVTSIGNAAFEDCDLLTSVTIGNSVNSIDYSAFYGCDSLTIIEIPDSVTSIGYSAFEGCTSLTSITIGNSVTSIGYEAFYGCNSLTKVNYTGTIDDWAQIEFGGGFASNPLYYAKNLYINDVLATEVVLTTATKISNYAFFYCNSLTSVTIGNSVTSIGNEAFLCCDSLTSVTFSDTSTWYITIDYSNWANKTGGTEFDVTDASNNAGYLLDPTYYLYKI